METNISVTADLRKKEWERFRLFCYVESIFVERKLFGTGDPVSLKVGLRSLVRGAILDGGEL